MHGQKATQKLRTHSSISNTGEIPASSIHRHSTSADRDNRLFLLHRKCPNPLVCVRGSANNSPPLLPLSVPVPFIGYSPVLCQPFPCKPRLRPVAPVHDAAAIHIVGNGMRDPCTDTQLPSSVSAKPHQLRRKVYFNNSHSADGRSERKQSSSENDLQEKVRTTNVYVPTGSSSVHTKLPSGSRKSRDKPVCDETGIQQNAYYIDVVQCDGRLRMEHVENPRPLPPRHYISASESNETCSSPQGLLRSPPDSASMRRCVTDSELRTSRHLICERTPANARSSFYERPLYTSPPVNMCYGDSERTFYHILKGLKQDPNNAGNSRTKCMDDGALQQRQCAHRSANKHRRQSLKKAVSNVSARVLHIDSEQSYNEGIGDNMQALLCDDSSECTDSCYARDKYGSFFMMLPLNRISK